MNEIMEYYCILKLKTPSLFCDDIIAFLIIYLNYLFNFPFLIVLIEQESINSYPSYHLYFQIHAIIFHSKYGLNI